MYKTMLVFNDYNLLNEIKNMNIWGPVSGFEIVSTQNNGADALTELRTNKYDLLITEIFLTQMDGLQLLRTLNQESINCRTVLCSEAPSFTYAREGIILGAYDYFVKPFENQSFMDMFERLKSKLNNVTVSAKEQTKNIIALFESYSPDLTAHMQALFSDACNAEPNTISAYKKIQQIYSDMISEIFLKNSWLEVYLDQDSFLEIDYIEGNSDKFTEFYIRKMDFLCKEYSSLFPFTTMDTVKDIMLYILDQPEDNLTLTHVAEHFYMNPSYLSTIFSTATGIRFVDYLALVRMKRAKWLIMNTDLKIAEIANRLSYKDTKYFSRIFKQHFGILPTECRVSEYDYTI